MARIVPRNVSVDFVFILFIHHAMSIQDSTDIMGPCSMTLILAHFNTTELILCFLLLPLSLVLYESLVIQ